MTHLIRASGLNGQAVEFWSDTAELLARFVTADGRHEDVYLHETTEINYQPGAWSPWPGPAGCSTWPKGTPLKNRPLFTVTATVILQRASGEATLIEGDELVRLNTRIEGSPFAVLRAKCLNATKHIHLLQNIRTDKLPPDRAIGQLWDFVRKLVQAGHAMRAPIMPASFDGYLPALAAVDEVREWCNEMEERPVKGDAGQFDGDKTSAPVLLTELSTAKDLAKHFGATFDQVDSFLRRYRKRYVDCYEKIDAARRNEVRYIYRVKDVYGPLKEALAKKLK